MRTLLITIEGDSQTECGECGCIIQRPSAIPSKCAAFDKMLHRDGKRLPECIIAQEAATKKPLTREKIDKAFNFDPDVDEFGAATEKKGEEF